jgi:hypothetical protein
MKKDEENTEAAGSAALDVEETELVEELAATAIINELLNKFIGDISEEFADMISLSENGNPVRTYIALVSFSDSVLTEAHNLHDELLDKVAKRGEEVTEKGDTLRTQVVGEDGDVGNVSVAEMTTEEDVPF